MSEADNAAQPDPPTVAVGDNARITGPVIARSEGPVITSYYYLPPDCPGPTNLAALLAFLTEVSARYAALEARLDEAENPALRDELARLEALHGKLSGRVRRGTNIEDALAETRELLAAGLDRWCVPQQMTDETQQQLLPSMAAAALWFLVSTPYLDLPARYPEALITIASVEIMRVTVEYNQKYHQRDRSKTDKQLHAELLTKLAVPQYQAGITRLCADMSDPQRGGSALTILLCASHGVPPSAASQQQVVRLPLWQLLALIGGGGLVAGVTAGTTIALLWKDLANGPAVAAPAPSATPTPTATAQPDTAPTALPARRVRPNLVETASGRLSIPISAEQWRDELTQLSTVFGDRSGDPLPYFCYVQPGTYRIGGWERGKEHADIKLPEFWIARVTVTNAQFAPFVREGYGLGARRWWTPNGWTWKQEAKRTQPWHWNERPYNDPDQPVIGVTWYEATAYCAYLAEQLVHRLPDGYSLRLPSEAEWEVAAAYDAQRQRRSYPWGEEAPTVRHAVFDQSKRVSAATIGSCPEGAAACGALDLAGNVWEPCLSSYAAYPQRSQVGQKDFTVGKSDIPWRGGTWYSIETYVRCGARYYGLPNYDFNYYDGFRIVVAPRLGP
jgi:formylglycine-generating enzyme required for sulfatase activity